MIPKTGLVRLRRAIEHGAHVAGKRTTADTEGFELTRDFEGVGSPTHAKRKSVVRIEGSPRCGDREGAVGFDLDRAASGVGVDALAKLAPMNATRTALRGTNHHGRCLGFGRSRRGYGRDHIDGRCARQRCDGGRRRSGHLGDFGTGLRRQRRRGHGRRGRAAHEGNNEDSGERNASHDRAKVVSIHRLVVGFLRRSQAEWLRYSVPGSSPRRPRRRRFAHVVREPARRPTEESLHGWVYRLRVPAAKPDVKNGLNGDLHPGHLSLRAQVPRITGNRRGFVANGSSKHRAERFGHGRERERFGSRERQGLRAESFG